MSSAYALNLDQSKNLLFDIRVDENRLQEYLHLIKMCGPLTLQRTNSWHVYQAEIQKKIAYYMYMVPYPPLFVVSTMVTWESSQWLGKSIVQSNG